MAVIWGSWLNNSTGNGMRLGYEFTQSPASVGTGTSSVTVTLRLYVETKAPTSDSSNSWSVTGNFSGSGSVSINNGSGGGTDLIGTFTRTVSTSYSGSVKSSFSASLSGINAIPGTASVSGNWYTAKRPISAPYAPDNIAGSRSSDTSHTVSWTKDPGTDAGHPYEHMEIQRWSLASGVYTTIVTLSGSATSYTDTSTKANNQYRWRVRAKNSAGSSGWVYTDYFSTTPNPPTGLTVRKIGDDVQLTWSLPTGDPRVTGIEVWLTQDGVDQGARHVLLSGQPTTWLHVAPSSTSTWQYRVKTQSGADVNDGAPNLYSAFSARSAVVQLLTNPLAPTQLSPSSGVRDAAAAPLTLTWQHNEIDGTAQTKYDLQYRLNGGAWTMVSAVTGTQAHTFAAGALPNGSTLDWQVRTYGQYATAPAYSPWSAVATLTLSATPQAGVVFPDDVTPVGTSRITAQWTYFDAETTTQAQWKVKLYSAGGAQLLEAKSGAGPSTSVALSSLLKNNTGYRLGVQVQDGSGLWSPEATQDFTVSYTLPNTPTVTLEWDPDRVAVVATIQNPTGGTGAAVDHNELWRTVDWQTYELVADNIPPNSAVTDFIPALGAENVYLAVAVSPIEAAAQSEPTIFKTPEMQGWFIVNGGADFSTISRVRYSPSLSRNFSRDKTLNAYAGREFPVETVGEQRKREYTLSVSIFGDDDASLAEIERIADIPGPLVLRTPLFDRMYVSLEGIGSTRANGYDNITMKLSQVDPPDRGTMDFEPIVYRTNWAQDPSFTDAALNKITAGGVTLALDTLDPASGTTFLHATDAAGGSFRYAGQSATIPAGYTYVRATVAARNLAGAGYVRARLGYRDDPASGTVTYSPAVATAAGATWQTLTIETVIPATTQYINVLVYGTDTSSGYTTAAGSEWGVDALCIEVGTTAENTGPATYFDGDTYEGDDAYTTQWSGTPNASPSQLVRGGSTE